MRRLTLLEVTLVVLSLAILPTAAAAQSVIVGVVTDASAAVLPGVTVVARSPALIEQVKSVVTDDRGQYRIVDLRPGAYTVTFSLPGFTTIVRDGITLPADFTATVDVQMRIGALEETVTVSGAAPVVDLESTRQRGLLTRTMADTLPTGRSVQNYALTMPAVSGKVDVGGQSNINAAASLLSVYGIFDGAQIVVDGMPLNQGHTNGPSYFYMNAGDFEEFSYTVNGALAEQAHAGVQSNLIPKSGGNRFSGTGLALWSHPDLVSKNASAAQIASGLVNPPDLVRLFDYNANLGGPIKRDRLWFYGSARAWTTDTSLNMVHDGRLGAPGEPVVDASLVKNFLGRLTWQVSPKNRFTVSYAREPRWRDYLGIETNTTRPEAASRLLVPVAYWAQAKWTSTVTNKILVEAGFAPNMRTFAGAYQKGTRMPPELPPYGDVAKFDPLRAQPSFNAPSNSPFFRWVRHYYVGSMTYVTGSHAFKAGIQYDDGYQRVETFGPNGSLRQDYRGSVPFGVVLLNLPTLAENRFWETGLYVQDSWKIGRLTLTPGLRFDKFVGSIPDQTAGAGFWMPVRTFDGVADVPNWADVSARFGASYALFGTGHTVVKGSLGRYMTRDGPGFPGRYNAMVTQGDPRDWTDRNSDDIAQASEIGPSRNPAWGIRRNRNPDPNLERSSDWLYNLTLEHQLRPGLGVSVGYNRRELKDPSWIDNLTNVPEDYQLLSVADPRGNGQSLPVYQVRPDRLGPVNELDKNSTNTDTYDGVDIMLQGRRSNGAFLIGGTSTGRVVSHACQVENLNALRFCDQRQFDIPFRTTFKLSGNHPLPWFGLTVSSVFQSIANAERIINYTVTRAQLPQLQTASSVVVRLNKPGSEYLKRVNMLDVTLAGTLHLRRTRVRPQISVFNLFNANEVLTETNQWPTHGRLLTIVPGRMVRLELQVFY